MAGWRKAESQSRGHVRQENEQKEEACRSASKPDLKADRARTIWRVPLRQGKSPNRPWIKRKPEGRRLTSVSSRQNSMARCLQEVAVPGSEGPRKILIVDDEAEVTNSLAAIFRKHEYEVRVANSAESAIEAIAVWEPDLAIVDVILPRMSGIDLAMVIRDTHPYCRLVLFSGQQTTQALLEEAAKKGHLFEILAKPVHPMFMLDYVSSRLAGRTRKTA
jgi:CheY-like chemotaxis protein